MLFTVCLHDVSIATLIIDFKGDFFLGGATLTVNATYIHSSGEVVFRGIASGLNVNFQTAATKLVDLNLPSALHRSIAIPDYIC